MGVLKFYAKWKKPSRKVIYYRILFPWKSSKSKIIVTERRQIIGWDWGSEWDRMPMGMKEVGIKEIST
jgi:hypothetical protein